MRLFVGQPLAAPGSAKQGQPGTKQEQPGIKKDRGIIGKTPSISAVQCDLNYGQTKGSTQLW